MVRLEHGGSNRDPRFSRDSCARPSNKRGGSGKQLITSLGICTPSGETGMTPGGIPTEGPYAHEADRYCGCAARSRLAGSISRRQSDAADEAQRLTHPAIHSGPRYR